MLKKLAILTASIFVAVGVPSQTNNASHDKKAATGQDQPVVIAPDNQKKQAEGQKNQAEASGHAPTGNATVEGSHWWVKPDWWLVVVAALTGGFIAWQSWETRRSVRAANRGMEISKTKERAKLLLSLYPLDPVVGQFPQAKLRVTNVGESSALFGRCIAGLHISDSESLDGNPGYQWLKIDNTVLKSEEHSEEMVWWPTHHFDRYTVDVIDGKEHVHLHGIINFRDAFNDSWRLKFHYIWHPYGAQVWLTHLQEHRYGEWDSQNDEGEVRVEPKAVKKWLKFWRMRGTAPERPKRN